MTSERLPLVEELVRLLKTRRRETRQSLRAVSAETGISASTLSRVERGSNPDAATLSRLMGWLEKEGVYHPPRPRRDNNCFLPAEPDLPPDTRRALEELFRVAYKVLKEETK